MKHKLLFILLVIGTQLSSTAQLLDNTFNGTGVWNAQVRNYYNHLNSVAIQPDGKILFCGKTFTYTGGFDTSRFFVGRLGTNGTPDGSFDADGYAEYKFSTTENNWAEDVLFLNNKIYSCGYRRNTSVNQLMLVRLNLNGSLDNTFNGSSALYTTTAGGSTDNILTSLQLTNTNKIVGLGSSVVSQSRLSGFAVDENAALVGTFGSSGLLYNSSVDAPEGKTVMQSDNKILFFAGGNLIRLNANGALDNTFGTSGIQSLNLASGATIKSVAVQKDGKIVLGGNDGNNKFYVERRNSDGTIDVTFGTSGKALVAFAGSSSFANAIVVDTTSLTGKIFAVGYSFYSVSNKAYFALARISPTNGSVEASAEFQPNGLTGQANDVALQPDGKIIIGGSSTGYAIEDFIVARVNANFTTVIAGVEEAAMLSSGFNLFPNPASQNINVHSLYAINHIRVIDILGNEVLNVQSAGNTQVDISNLPKGLYNFVITTDHGMGSKKVSVQ